MESTRRPNDIVCGRGAPTNFHPGNEAFHNLIQQYQARYQFAKRSDKQRIALDLLSLIESHGGRFVRRV